MLPMKPIQAKALKSMITEQKPPSPGPSLVNIRLQPFAKRRKEIPLNSCQLMITCDRLPVYLMAIRDDCPIQRFAFQTDRFQFNLILNDA